MVMTEITSSDKLINEDLDKVRVRRSVALLRNLKFHRRFQIKL